MKKYVVEDGDSGTWDVEAENPKDAIREACPDAVHIELLYWVDGVGHYALFDEESEHYDDVQVREV